ncbi:MAG: helix-turn-helix domain-containing protein [bacterium]
MDEIGVLLREERESSGVSIKEAGVDLSVKESILENIENGCIGAFKDVFELKDIIYNYSKYLGLDAEEMTDKFNSYLFEYTSKIPLKEIEKEVNEKAKEEEGDKVLSPYTKEYQVSYKKYYILIIILLLILIAISFWWAKNQIAIGGVTTTYVTFNK